MSKMSHDIKCSRLISNWNYNSANSKTSQDIYCFSTLTPSDETISKLCQNQVKCIHL